MKPHSDAAPRKLRLALGSRSYDILIGQGLLGDAQWIDDVIAGPDVLVVSNETVAPLYLERVLESLSSRRVTTHILPDGETFKTPEQMLGIIDTLLDAGAARDVTLIALGGGVVGDITGFAAACFMRGVNVIQVPTTLLSQVDSSVGGKTGVNHPAGKNLIGAFHQPVRVVIDTTTLDTLPPREFAAGLAEILKAGAIADAEFFDWLEANIEALRERSPAALAEAIYRSCAIKASVVSDDEREAGRRAILNFGHTFGHAIEACTGFGPWLHGEAVGAGMRMAAAMSPISDDERARLNALLDAAGLPQPPENIPGADLKAAMSHDKKVQAGRIRLILLSRLGDAFVTDDYADTALDAVLGVHV